MTLHPGSQLQNGKYEIVRFIKSGGFGCTYEAKHVLAGYTVAIKEFFVKDFCNRDSATGQVTVATDGKKGLVEKLRGKFIHEARTMMALHHPGIVRLTDVFEENNTAYYVMDYIEGLSLSEILESRGALDENVAVDYIRQVSDALKYVHKRKCLHLDIKPGNIMIDPAGNAILIDFGVSKQYDEVDGENTSSILGRTPGFAPPEQMGNNVRLFASSTDIYSLGATLYKLLSGITPLDASTRSSGEELEPLPSGVSESVRVAVFAAMRMNKSERPQCVEDFVALLDSKDATAAFGKNGKTVTDMVAEAEIIDDVTVVTEENVVDAGVKTVSKGKRGVAENGSASATPVSDGVTESSGNEQDNKSEDSSGFLWLLLVAGIAIFLVLGFNASDRGDITSRPYMVGDYYNNGSIEGIVFEVTDSGYHGKIMSLEETIAPINGLDNAEQWCLSLDGYDWRLPSVSEMQAISNNRYDIKHSLDDLDKGFDSFYVDEFDTSGEYWSNIKEGAKPAGIDEKNEYVVSMIDGKYRSCEPGRKKRVRAVAEF